MIGVEGDDSTASGRPGIDRLPGDSTTLELTRDGSSASGGVGSARLRLLVVVASFVLAVVGVGLWLRDGDTREVLDVPLGTPRVVGSLVVAPTVDGFLGLTFGTSDVEWEYTDCPLASWANPRSASAGPTLSVLCGPDDLRGLDPQTGAERWRTELLPDVEFVEEGPSVVVVSAEHSATVIDRDSGETRFVIAYGDPMAVADGERVYVSSTEGIGAWDAVSGELLWTNEEYPPTWVSLAPQGVLLRHHKGIDIIDPASGELVSEAGDDLADNTLIAGVTGGTAVAHSLDLGLLTALDLETGEVAWRYESNGVQSTSTSVGPDYVLVFDGIQLTALDARTGTVVDHVEDSLGMGAASDSTMVYVRSKGAGYELRYEELPD